MKVVLIVLLLSLSGQTQALTIKQRKLTNVTPIHLIELVAINDGRDSIYRIDPFELKKHENHYSYEFYSYAGEGSNKRYGKISLEGIVLERNIDFSYCSHSMGPENKCYFVNLKEKVKNEQITGHCKITSLNDDDVISLVQILNKSTLEKAKNICNPNMLKFLIPKKIDVSLLKPYKSA